MFVYQDDVNLCRVLQAVFVVICVSGSCALSFLWCFPISCLVVFFVIVCFLAPGVCWLDERLLFSFESESRETKMSEGED